MTRTLVVGGYSRFVKETVTKKLARWGLAVEWHVELGKRQEKHPSADARCEVIVVLREALSHIRLVGAWEQYAQQRGIRCVVLSGHESHWAEQMARYGINPIPPVAAAAVADVEENRQMAQQQKTAAPPPTEFHERLAFVKELLKEMHEKDGVQSVAWDAKSGLIRAQREVRVVQEEAL